MRSLVVILALVASDVSGQELYGLGEVAEAVEPMDVQQLHQRIERLEQLLITKPVVKQQTQPIRMFTIPGCSACQQWARDCFPEFYRAGYRVAVQEQQPQPGRVYPHFTATIGGRDYLWNVDKLMTLDDFERMIK